MNKENWVEVFRAGKYPLQKVEITEEDLDKIIKNSEIEDMPLTTDHKTEGKALGWVDKLKREGKKLYATFRNVQDELKTLVNTKQMPKRSIEFKDDEKGNRRVRAITFLGANSPQVKGMADFTFSEKDEVISINFAEPTPPQIIDGVPIFETESGFQIRALIPENKIENYTTNLDNAKGVSVDYTETSSKKKECIWNFDKASGNWSIGSVVTWFRSNYSSIERAVECIDYKEDEMGGGNRLHGMNYSISPEGIIKFEENKEVKMGEPKKEEEKIDIVKFNEILAENERLKKNEETIKFNEFVNNNKTFLDELGKAGKLLPPQIEKCGKILNSYYGQNEIIAFSENGKDFNQYEAIKDILKNFSEQVTIGGNKQIQNSIVEKSKELKEMTEEDLDFSENGKKDMKIQVRNNEIIKMLADKENISFNEKLNQIIKNNK